LFAVDIRLKFSSPSYDLKKILLVEEQKLIMGKLRALPGVWSLQLRQDPFAETFIKILLQA
jgi:hypothetical protein